MKYINEPNLHYPIKGTECTSLTPKVEVHKVLRTTGKHLPLDMLSCPKRLIFIVDSSWNVMVHGDAREEKWKGNWRMELVASTLHTTSEHGLSSIITADAHTSVASSRVNWCPRRFKWTRPFRRKTKFGFCAFAITFQLASTADRTSHVAIYVSVPFPTAELGQHIRTSHYMLHHLTNIRIWWPLWRAEFWIQCRTPLRNIFFLFGECT